MNYILANGRMAGFLFLFYQKLGAHFKEITFSTKMAFWLKQISDDGNLPRGPFMIYIPAICAPVLSVPILIDETLIPF